MVIDADTAPAFPLPLSSYPDPSGSLLDTLVARLHVEPFNAVATVVFVLAVLHTFGAARFTDLAHRVQHQHEARLHQKGARPHASVLAELLHFLGEVEVVFGLWAVVLVAALVWSKGWATATHYLNAGLNYTEPLFVVVIMALASSRPIVGFAESGLRRVANLWRGTPAAWWVTILTIGPLLGALMTEPAAMTICALLLGRQFYALGPSTRLKYATLGLLFVNISIGGTLTHFAAPAVLMVARPWAWGLGFMLRHFGLAAMAAIALSTLSYLLVFRREFASIDARQSGATSRGRHGAQAREPGGEDPDAVLLPVPVWIITVHVAFMAWTVMNAHYPVLFVGGFLFFLGFVRATAAYQSRVDLEAPLLVGFFLAGLVVHGGLQGWWIAPVLGSLSAFPTFLVATGLTAFNDNALVTYLATLVPSLDPELKIAIVRGAVTGGGLTVIANAPNPAGHAILGKFFDGAVHPLALFAAALVPTLIAATMFWLI